MAAPCRQPAPEKTSEYLLQEDAERRSIGRSDWNQGDVALFPSPLPRLFGDRCDHEPWRHRISVSVHAASPQALVTSISVTAQSGDSSWPLCNDMPRLRALHQSRRPRPLPPLSCDPLSVVLLPHRLHLVSYPCCSVIPRTTYLDPGHDN